jgi:HlyD family secretion protein
VRLLFVGLISLFLSSCDSNDQNIALGTLERNRIAHTATTNEIVVELPIVPGSQVTKGTVLVRLDDTLQRAQVEKAQADVAAATATLQRLQHGARDEELAIAKANVAGAKASLVEKEANYQRAKNMVEHDSSSKADLDRALAARDLDLAQLSTAEEQLRELITGAREEDVRIATANLQAATATLTIEQKNLADLTISSTRDGILDNLPWNLGERVTAGSPLAIVLAGKAPFARIYVPEPYRIKLTVGDKLLVHVDGLDDAITGQLSWIANEPAFSPYYALNQKERAHLMYLAEVQLPDSAANLPNGVPAQVELP